MEIVYAYIQGRAQTHDWHRYAVKRKAGKRKAKTLSIGTHIPHF
jgi:hypothetical protein